MIGVVFYRITNMRVMNISTIKIIVRRVHYEESSHARRDYTMCYQAGYYIYLGLTDSQWINTKAASESKVIMSIHKVSSSDVNVNVSEKPHRYTPSIRETIQGFGAETTAHGIPRVIDRPRYRSKLFWAVLVLALFGVFIFQAVRLLRDYYTFNTKIELVNSEEVEFPAITVCNLNRIRLSRLPNNKRWESINNQTAYESNQNSSPIRPTPPFGDSTIPPLLPRPDIPNILERDGITTSPVSDHLPDEKSHDRIQRDVDDGGDDDYDWFRDSIGEEEYQWPHSTPSPGIGRVVGLPPTHLGSLASPYLGIRPPSPTKEELREMGHRREDFILECRFNKQRCGADDFRVIQNKQYGNCFTFNGVTSTQSSPRRVTKAGSGFGLHLTLYIEHDEYIGAMTEDTGVRIVAHPRDILPHPEDLGLSFSPGFTSNIGLRQVEIKRLPYPHGNCTYGKDRRHLSDDVYEYNIISCQKRCLQDGLADRCGCVTDIYNDYDSFPQCNRTNRICRQTVEKSFYQNQMDCKCPAKCREFIYNTKATSSVWPSEKHLDYWKKGIERPRGFVQHPAFTAIQNIGEARMNLVKVKVYFEELNYELVEQVPAHTFESAVGTIGGLIGLYIGFSLITVSEILVLFYDVARLMIVKAFYKETVDGSES